MQIKVLKGMKDVLPSSSGLWQDIEQKMRETAKVAGYQEIRTPVVELTQLFTRGVGDTSDIVQKEMYTFLDKGGRSITLKPEGTAGTVRAFLEANLYAETLPCKLYYLNSPIFRYESPQSGRLREHHQFGLECFGSSSPSTDAEIISMVYELFQKFGFKNVKLQINSIGCPKCRPQYTQKLKEFLNTKKEHLCYDCLNRYEKNPLRVLDCKQESCKQAIKDSPQILDVLCDECDEHFKKLKTFLELTSIPFIINPQIVRGLDYYTKTVFEFVQETENGLLTICGGGRYDNLIEELGGPSIPAVGCGIGIERLIMLMDNEKSEFLYKPDIFICNISKEDLTHAYSLMLNLRENNIITEIDHMNRSLKAQFKFANKINAKYILIVGGEELQRNVYKLRNMNTKEEIEIETNNAINRIINLVGVKL